MGSDRRQLSLSMLKSPEFYRFFLAFFWAAMPIVGFLGGAAAWTREGHESSGEK